MSAIDSGSETDASNITWWLILVGTVAPLAAVSVGVDGGEIFQILAIDSLQLSPKLIGIALGLGTLSIPLQIWAAGMPIERAAANLRIHLVLSGVMTGATAVLVQVAKAGSTLASTVLAIAILAELAVSVLLATSWQPIISYVLSAQQRAFLLGPGRAISGMVLLGSVFVFGQLDRTGRSAFLLALALACWALCWGLRVLPKPERESTELTATGGSAPTDDAFRRLFFAFAASALAGWPLLLTYVALVLWPGANLGVLGASLALGGTAASAMWRDPGPRLLWVIRASVFVFVCASLAIATFPGPVESTIATVWLLVVMAVGSATRSLIRTGINEVAHRLVDQRSAVKVMTMIDVVGSTTFQLGFFVVGFLISASEASAAALDPFQLWLIATSACLVWAISRLSRDSTLIV